MIERITAAEFEAVRYKSRHRAEVEAVCGLKPLTGVKFPCKWKHSGKSRVCGGVYFVRRFTVKAGFKMSTRCKDGMFYAFREA